MSAEDRNQRGKLFILQLSQQALEVDIQESDIVKLLTLGKREVSKPIPLLVTISSTQNKLLKSANARYREISVSHDQTMAQHAASKKAYKYAIEADEKKEKAAWKK